VQARKHSVCSMGGELRRKIPSSRTRFFSRLGVYDLAWAASSPLLAFLVRDGGINRTDTVVIYCCIALAFSLIVFQWFKISAPISGYFSVHDAFAVAQACLIIVSLTAVFLFTFTRLDAAPRSIPIIHFFILASGLFGGRAIIRLAAKRHAHSNVVVTGKEPQNVLILEASRLAWFFTKMVEEFSFAETRIVAILDERPWLFNRSINGYTIVGPPAQLSKIIDEYSIHGVQIHRVAIAAQSKNDMRESWSKIREICEARNIQIEWLNERFSLPASTNFMSSNYQNVLNEPATGWSYLKLKRLLDILLSVVAIAVISPLAMLVAALVLVDIGAPIVFWQQRLGRYGRPLHVYKFRTMRATFDRDGNPIPESQRVSLVGRILRDNRLDEIPQLINILKGDMSFVGPRPLLPADQPEYARIRLQVRPGLTGLAQVNGATLLSIDEKNALDEWYIRHASLLLDIAILIRTMWVVVLGEKRNELTISAALAERKFIDEMHA
jgi:lipopolysaccharide/colanic/teichoic acid biosynthesis glycosyltransferase